ncbi:BQ2448_1701 [Microbotryum intermedium]|uniref:fumarate reductase (NADH) n=1 Tax=Microbotryum intermedium TaxID=269621 RepID=A0A238FAW4_9BASI|nr:BQ2448_1701 [Microbotryum intermedium]
MQNQVIVVGGGLSGLSAAHTLYERGASTLVLDKNPFFGGNSTKATSGINGAGTKAQANLNIPDSAKAFFDDTKKSHGGRVALRRSWWRRAARDLARDDLIEVLTGQSGDAVNWLMDKFGLDLSKVSRLGGHSYERTHRGGAQFPGMTITFAQMEALEDLAQADPERVKILKKAAVTKLIKDGDEVVGVEYEYQGSNHKAYGPVVLATGGYAADFSKSGLLQKYRPDLMHLPTTNGDHCTGDGQKMVIDIGGNGIDLEKVQVHPTGLVDPKEPDAKVKFLAAEALRGVGGLLLDAEGNRFADELGHRDYVTGRMWDNNKFPVRLILNGEASKEIEWHCKHYCGRGLMKRFETGEEVAKEMGLSKDKLAQVFADYVAVTKDPKKDPFGKKFFHNTDWSLKSGPFHVALMTPVLHYTMGGVEIDPASRVLDTAGKPIPGLFASGEIAGGVHGANRLGGSSLLGCVVFGRVAGASAASYLLKSISTSGKANSRLNQVGGHLGMATTVRIDHSSKKVHLEFSWDDQGASASSPSSAGAQTGGPAGEAKAATPAPAAAKEEKPAQKEYTLEEVAKHNTKDDCWVVVNGQVLNTTDFLADHPGGPKAILLYAGKDATEEFMMVHEASVISKYAANTIIGTLKN